MIQSSWESYRRGETLKEQCDIKDNILLGAPAASGGGHQPPVQQIGVDTIRRDEVNAVLANQREIVSASRDIK